MVGRLHDGDVQLLREIQKLNKLGANLFLVVDERRSGEAPWPPAGRKIRIGSRWGEEPSIHRRHLVLAVEVGEADLGGVLERAVGLAPLPGTHARAPGAAVPRRRRAPPRATIAAHPPAGRPTSPRASQIRSPDPSLARDGRRGPHQGRRTGGAGSRRFGGKASRAATGVRGRAGTPSASPWGPAQQQIARFKNKFILMVFKKN